VLLLGTLLAGCGSPLGDDDDEQVTLRLGVQMTAPELASFEEGLAQIREDHPEWNIVLEQTPQEGFQEKFNSQIASSTLPDVIQLGISHAQQGAGQGALLDLTDLIESEDFNTDDFWAGALDPYLSDGNLYGIPFSASPDVLFYNTAMFDAAGLPYPTDEWTFEDVKAAAVKLTLDENGNSADSPDFDPDAVVQWGFNTAPAHVFSRNVFLLPFGGDPCVNERCDEMAFAAQPVVDAMSWWVDLVAVKHAAPYDPYSGNQTGVPGDPFIAGLAAMGMNGYFAVGQLNAVGTLQYDIVQPPMGPDGQRSTALSISGYGIAANSAQPEAAFELVQELTSADFVASYWAEDGHGVNPADRPAPQRHACAGGSSTGAGG
jgi:multiple sugar transport system substrate-binding protein